MEITKIAKDLQVIRIAEVEKKEELKAIQYTKQELQDKLMQLMGEQGIKSIKTETHNYAITTKKDINIVDENVVIEQLKLLNNGIAEQYVRLKLDSVKFKVYAKALLKEKGEIIDGTEPVQKEYLTIKSSK